MSVTSDPKPSLAGLSFNSIKDKLENIQIPTNLVTMRAKQLRRWIHHLGVTNFDAMTDIDKNTRSRLAEHYSIARPDVINTQWSLDGTGKFLIRFNDGAMAETVFIPDVGKTGAVCISCQIGCALNCSFCHTGTQKRLRNLTAQEMVAQVMIVRDILNEWPASKEKRKLSNVVFMGMGEPLYNLDAVTDAVNTLADGDGMSISTRRITVSTAGVAPKIVELGKRCRAMLAVSLHAADDELRSQLIPLNRKYSIKTLLDAVRAYPELGNGRRVTFEYLMLDGINDSNHDARKLTQLIRGIPAKINLIPFNPWPGTSYRPSTPERIAAFANILFRAGYASPVRTSRGSDIAAACGQLCTSAQSKPSSTSHTPSASDNSSPKTRMSIGSGDSKLIESNVTG